MQYNNYQLCNVNIYHHSCVYYYLHYKYHQDVPVMLIMIFVNSYRLRPAVNLFSPSRRHQMLKNSHRTSSKFVVSGSITASYVVISSRQRQTAIASLFFVMQIAVLTLSLWPSSWRWSLSFGPAFRSLLRNM